MEIEFGSFKKYISERGFGFVDRTLSNPHKKEVFFHIRNIKKSNSDFANKLNNDEDISSEYFWYEIAKTNKGDQLSSVITPTTLKAKYSDNFPVFIGIIEKVWMNTNTILPKWVEYAATDLVDASFVINLKKKREVLEQKIKDEREKQQKEAASQRKIEDDEFNLLVEEIKTLRFTHTKAVSSYIMRNQLGHKYKNISGIVKMEMDGNTWDFNGGFPPEIYARLCEELLLSNQGSHAKVVSFKPFKTIYE